MHIIGGKLKGRKLANCKKSSIRPAMALVRKSIFDSLQDIVPHSNILDLCAGTGVLGIEALSRGASKLTLIDSDKDAIKLIIKNLTLCKLDAKAILDKLPKALYRRDITNQKFDLIFLDPPYGMKEFVGKNLEVIISNHLLSKDGLISVESETKCDLFIPKELKLYKEKRFGRTKITFLIYNN